MDLFPGWFAISDCELIFVGFPSGRGVSEEVWL